MQYIVDLPGFPKAQPDETQEELDLRVSAFNKKYFNDRAIGDLEAREILLAGLEAGQVQARAGNDEAKEIAAEVWQGRVRTLKQPGDAFIFSDLVMAQWPPPQVTTKSIHKWFSDYLDAPPPRGANRHTADAAKADCNSQLGLGVREIRAAWSSLCHPLKKGRGRPQLK